MTLFLRPLSLVLLLLLAGCGWWGGEEEVEPAPLVDFEAELKVDTLWTAKVGAGLGEKYQQYRPALLGNRIYVSDAEGNLIAFDRDTGERIWQQALDLAVSGGLGAGDGKVALTTYDGQIHLFRALDGSPIWQSKLSSEAVAPASIIPGTVLVQTIDGRLTAFDSETGARRWAYSAQIPSLTLRGTSTPLLEQGVAFAGFSNGKVVALDGDSGELLWESRIAVPQGKSELERIVDVDGSLRLSDGLLYVTSYQGRAVALSARDGRQLWAQDASSYQGVALAPTQVYLSDARGHVQALERRNGNPIWEQDGLFFRQLSSPAVLSGAVAVADFEGYVHFLAGEDGRFLARTRVDTAGIRGPLLVADERLYVLGNGGRLAALTLTP